MDLADDIRAQEEISTAKQELWSCGLSPEGKENTDEAKAFVKRMTDVASKLAALVKEGDGEAAKYGQDIVLMAAFNNAQKSFDDWIAGAEKKITVGYPSPNNMEEATTMVNDCKVPRNTSSPLFIFLTLVTRSGQRRLLLWALPWNLERLARSSERLV